MKVYIIAVISVDGYICNETLDQRSWTSVEDKEYFKQKTLSSGVVIMGNKTYQKIGRPLAGRLNIVYTKNKSLQNKSNLEYTDEYPKKLIEELRSRGFNEAAVIGGQEIYSLFMNSGLVTDLYLTTEPIVLGSGKTLLCDVLTNQILKLESTEHLTLNTTLAHYKTHN